jgi:DNA-directed RNA polymerase specialized sigma24 family protein
MPREAPETTQFGHQKNILCRCPNAPLPGALWTEGSFAMAPTSPTAQPVASVLSVAETTDGIRNLSPVDQYKFKRASQYLSFGGARPAADLRHEAVRRAIAGTRKCPRNLQIIAFLIGVMRSIADADRKALKRIRHESPSDHAESNTLLDCFDPRESPEEQILRTEEIEEMKRQVLAVFEDDPVAQTLVEGQFIGLEGQELRELVGLNDKDFATKRRLVRRRIDKAFPHGWKP